MSEIIVRVKSILHNNKKVVENYFFMTIMQILNSLFYILIYPYLIRTLGPESYGLYVFATSIVTYFFAIINFGFDMPAIKVIAQNVDNKAIKEDTLSCVFTAKVILGVVSLVIFSAIVLSIPSLRVNWILFYICFLQIITHIIFPQWYFQGVQRMRTVTYIQLGFKLLSLPLIFIFVKQENDIWTFTSIISSFSIFGALTAALIIRYKEGLIVTWSKIDKVKKFSKEALPFFATNSMIVVKQQSAAVILGSFFTMKDVALYDLAMKIYTVPTVLISSLNNALFPKIVIIKNLSQTVKKLLKIENLIGVSVILFLTISGKWIISIMGGNNMLDAYSLLIILSFGIFGQLTVGAICNFIFIPLNEHKYIAKNQLIAFMIFFSFTFIGILLIKGIYIVPLALTLSVLSELMYSQYIVRKKRMLK